MTRSSFLILTELGGRALVGPHCTLGGLRASVVVVSYVSRRREGPRRGGVAPSAVWARLNGSLNPAVARCAVPRVGPGAVHPVARRLGRVPAGNFVVVKAHATHGRRAVRTGRRLTRSPRLCANRRATDPTVAYSVRLQPTASTLLELRQTALLSSNPFGWRGSRLASSQHPCSSAAIAATASHYPRLEESHTHDTISRTGSGLVGERRVLTSTGSVFFELPLPSFSRGS